MAGHSHAKNVMRRKNAVDAKRGKVFSKLAKHIIAAARQGADPNMNLRLKYAVDKAKEANMPKDNIERAIKRGSGQVGGDAIEEIMYEGYGPAGTALLVQTCTDNKNRTGPAIRAIFDRGAGNFGSPGSVAWMFKQQSVFIIDKDQCDEDQLTELILECGGDDLQVLDDVYEVSGPPEAFGDLVKCFEQNNIATKEGELTWVADNTIAINDKETAQKIINLIEKLEDNEDVTAVHCNWELADDVASQL